MADGPLLLVLDHADAADVDHLPGVTDAVLDAWPGKRPLHEIVSYAEIRDNPKRVDSAGLVWLLCKQPSVSNLSSLTHELLERRRPVAWRGANEHASLGADYDGAVVIPDHCDPRAAAAVLSALRIQTPILREAENEIRLLQAHRGGLSSQVSKLDEELRLAAEIQREFLPGKLPAVKQVSTHAMWRPAGYVSGDLYDAQMLDEHHIGFFIADAVGHGVPAALMTIFIKQALQTKEISPTEENGYRLLGPGEALGRLNDAMVEHQQGRVRFCTAAYGIIDTRSLELRFARAGHPFPILLRGNGETESLEPDGGLLGVFPNETFEETVVTLDAGDRFLLYSDGFEMAFPRTCSESGKTTQLVSDDYTEELEDLRHGEVDDALIRFCGKLDQQAGSLNQRDDLTVLCVNVNQPASEATGSVTTSHPAITPPALPDRAVA